MEEYIEGLTSEFREHYRPIADGQRVYEGKVDAALKHFADSGGNEPAPTIQNTPWEHLTSSKFPRLGDLIGQSTEYKANSRSPWTMQARRFVTSSHASSATEHPEHNEHFSRSGDPIGLASWDRSGVPTGLNGLYRVWSQD